MLTYSLYTLPHLALFIFKYSCICAVVFLVGCKSYPEVKAVSGFTMGTTYSVKYFSEKVLPQTLFDNRLKELNRSMSTYIHDSEISLFNASSLSLLNVSDDFAIVFNQAKQVYQLSQGAFEPTIMPLVDLWGFGPKFETQKVPDVALIELVLSEIGFDVVFMSTLNEISSTAKRQLDFSAIAKGYGVDVVAKLLESEGVQHYLVEIGGEVKAKGVKPNGDTWKIAIEKPVAENRTVQKIVEMKDVAIATSGDYRNYFEQDGVRYSHTIDPRTGYPIKHRLVSVSVMHESASMADAFATALMVMGPEEGVVWAQQNGISAFFISKGKMGFIEQTTNDFVKFIAQ